MQDNDPECAEAAEQAFGTVDGLVEACQSEGQLTGEDALQRALRAWSLVYGIAKLAVAQRCPFRSKAEVLKFAKAAIDGSFPSASAGR